MTAARARRPLVATLLIWWSLQTGATGMQSCPPPEVNFLSRAIFPMPLENSNSAAEHLSGRYDTGTEARYLCDPGYILIGDSVRVCNDTRWSGTAPHCYLNAAERSSLAVMQNALADGDTATHQFLKNLLHRENGPLLVKLYFRTKIKLVIVVADDEFEGAEMKIDFMSGDEKIFGTTAALQASRRRRNYQERQAEFIVFDNPDGRPSPEVDTLSVSLPQPTGLDSNNHGLKIYELQIVADSTELSWRQCLDEIRLSEDLTQMNTWAVGDRCYHLVTRLQDQRDAERDCKRLGVEGTLYRPDTDAGLDLVLDMLSVEGLFRHTRAKTHVWVHGTDGEDHGQDSQARCRLLSLEDRNITYGNCQGRQGLHPYICQRAPRLCGRFPRSEGLLYTSAAEGGVDTPHLRDDTVNVTCADPDRTRGHITCLAPDWTPPDFCEPTITGPARPPPPNTGSGGVLGAVLGGSVGAMIVLAAITLLVVRERNGRRQRRLHKHRVPPLDDSSEFLGLQPNPIYGGASGHDDDEHLYSEVSNPDAIYEECSYVAPARQPSPEPPPPPPPATRPSVSSLADTADAPDSADPDYEVFPMEVDGAMSGNLSAERSCHPAPPMVQTDPDYEPFPVESPSGSGGHGYAAGNHSATTTAPTPAAPGICHPPPTLEYAVPLVRGKLPDGRQRNQSFDPPSIDVAPVAGEAEYAEPYRAPRAPAERRSIPDVAMEAMGVGAAGPG